MATTSKKISRSFLASLILLIAGCASAPPPTPVTPSPAASQEGLAGYDRNCEATFRIDVRSDHGEGHGSGAVISKEGYILTVAHVVEHDGTLTILIQEGTKPPVNYPATVVAKDKDRDLAVVKINRRFADSAVLAEDYTLRAGDGVYAIGYPIMFGQMVARGHVQRLHYSDYRTASDDDGPVYVRDQVLADFLTGPGGSGSGVFLEKDGKLVGVMRILIQEGRGMSAMMVRGFIPVEQVRSFLEANRIPYALPDGKVKTYAPLPPPPAPAAKPAPAATPPQAPPPAPAKPGAGAHK